MSNWNPFFFAPGPILGRKLRLQLIHIWIHTELKNPRTTGCWLRGIPGTSRPLCWTSPNLPRMTPVPWSRSWASTHSDTSGRRVALQALLSSVVGLRRKEQSWWCPKQFFFLSRVQNSFNCIKRNTILKLLNSWWGPSCQQQTVFENNSIWSEIGFCWYPNCEELGASTESPLPSRPCKANAPVQSCVYVIKMSEVYGCFGVAVSPKFPSMWHNV